MEWSIALVAMGALIAFIALWRQIRKRREAEAVARTAAGDRRLRDAERSIIEARLVWSRRIRRGEADVAVALRVLEEIGRLEAGLLDDSEIRREARYTLGYHMQKMQHDHGLSAS